MTDSDFNIVEFLEETIASDEQYLIRLKCLYDNVADRYHLFGRKHMWVVQSDVSRSFAGEVKNSDNFALRYDATECRIFMSKKEAVALKEAFEEAELAVSVVDYLDAIGAEIDSVKKSIPETKKALLNAQEMAA